MLSFFLGRLVKWIENRRFSPYDRANVILNHLSQESRQKVHLNVCPFLLSRLRTRSKAKFEPQLELSTLCDFLKVDIELTGRSDDELQQLRAHLVCALDGYVKTDPNRAAQALTILAGEPLQQAGVLHGSELSPGQRAAVLFVSLPPEDSASIFSHLSPESVQAITLSITQLPPITSFARVDVIREFLGETLKDDLLIERFETTVRRDFAATSQRICDIWLTTQKR